MRILDDQQTIKNDYFSSIKKYRELREGLNSSTIPKYLNKSPTSPQEKSKSRIHRKINFVLSALYEF